ncbi:MFS transporter [Acinetobacter sp. NCu2D-2]|nr:MFS transporter [Acinetobacter sp. NCu2D-2]
MISLGLIIGMLGTALPSPLYPLYQYAWELSPSQITYIFVAYMFGCLATLLFFGRTSNTIGFLNTLKIGLMFICLGLVISIFSENAIHLSFGRFIIGIASGLISTSSLIGLMQNIPQKLEPLASQIVSIITVIGFGLGPFVGGLIGQFAQYPLVTPYIPVTVMALICFIGLQFIKVKPFQPQAFNICPRLERPSNEFNTAFSIIILTAFSTFAAFSLFASLSPSFAREVLPWHGPLMSGFSITLILIISGSSQWLARHLAAQKCLSFGLFWMFISLICLALCMTLKMSALFFISAAIFGAGHGIALMGAFGLIQTMTDTQNRAAVTSTYLFFGYLGAIIPILIIGWCADHFGLNISVTGYCMVIGTLCLSLWIGFKRVLKNPVLKKAL